MTEISANSTSQQPSSSSKEMYEFAVNEDSLSRRNNISLRDVFKSEPLTNIYWLC